MYNDPFYFAIRNWTPLTERQNAPAHIKATYGIEGRVEHVRQEDDYRLYRIVRG